MEQRKYDMSPIAQTYEQEPRLIETAVVLDIDRTLLDTNELVRLLCMSLAEHGIDIEAATEEASYIHAQQGQRFQAMKYLRDKYSEATVEAIQLELLRKARDGEVAVSGLVYEGAADLLGILDEQDVPYGAFTYGDQADQAWKIALIRLLMKRDNLNFPATTTQEKRKAEWLHAQKQEHGHGDHLHYIPAGFMTDEALLARTLIILDDKAENLTSQDKTIVGILINNAMQADGSCSLTELCQRLRQGETLLSIARECSPPEL